MATLKELTGGEVAGSGVFDELMRTVKAHLLEEFKAQRISGTDYANVYLGALQNVLATASQFTLQAPITTQQELLIKEQILSTRQGIEVAEAQEAQIRQQTTLIAAQVESERARELNVTSSTALNARQLDVLSAQITQAVAQTELIGVQRTVATNQAELTDSQRTQVEYQTSTVLPQQVARTTAEVTVLNERRETERAQTLNTRTDGITPVSGNVGRQNELLTRQAEGYVRNAEQNAAKIFADFFSIIQSTDGVTDYAAFGASGPNVSAVLDRLKEGIGVMPNP